MKICPECGKENFDKSFCTNCGHDISDVETEEERAIREEKKQQKEIERKEREQKQKQAEIERREREQKEKQEEIERKEREQKRKQAEIERREREEKERQKRKRKSKLKIIGVLIIIIAILCAGLFFVMNQNNTQSISDVPSSDGNTVDEQINSNVNTDNAEFKTVDFNGLFRADVPVESNYSEWPHGSNLDSVYTWCDASLNYHNYVYYFIGYDNLNDIISRFSDDYNIKTEGNLVIFESNDDCAVGVQSNNNQFVVFTSEDVSELDNLKQIVNSIVFE